jgi:aryl-alcohol dehydrogenase-like predicted oxidoreductase
MNKKGLDRRDFLKKAPSALVGLAAAAGAGAGLGDLARPAWAQEHAKEATKKTAVPGGKPPKVQGYRRLGRTGLEVSDLSTGACIDEEVLRYAYDRGINFFDTADSYYMGAGEDALGKAFHGMRDKVVIATKHMVEPSWKKETLIEKVNASLERLKTDYVDMLFVQGVGDPALFKNEEILSAYETLKKDGKYRHLCFSTHDTDTVVPAAIESNLFDAAMLMYDSSLFPKMEEMHTKLHEADLGIIAMKVLRGAKHHDVQKTYGADLTYAQASIRWALNDKKVASVLIMMRTFEHIDEYLNVSGSGMS